MERFQWSSNYKPDAIQVLNAMDAIKDISLKDGKKKAVAVRTKSSRVSIQTTKVEGKTQNVNFIRRNQNKAEFIEGVKSV
jgi:pectin methylesterase-like acyl-CoA thioesterase